MICLWCNLYWFGMFSICFPGTRIVYDRTFLLQMRNSPLARTPPKNLPVIPGITTDAPAQVLPKSPLSNSLVKTGKKMSNTKIPLLFSKSSHYLLTLYNTIKLFWFKNCSSFSENPERVIGIKILCAFPTWKWFTERKTFHGWLSFLLT